MKDQSQNRNGKTIFQNNLGRGHEHADWEGREEQSGIMRGKLYAHESLGGHGALSELEVGWRKQSREQRTHIMLKAFFGADTGGVRRKWETGRIAKVLSS